MLVVGEEGSTSQRLLLDLVKMYKHTSSPRTFLRGRDARENDEVSNLSDSHWKHFFNQTWAHPLLGALSIHDGKWLQILIEIGFVPSLANEMAQGQDNWHQPPVRAVTVTLSFAAGKSPVQCNCDLLLFPLQHTFEETGI